jgi:hypothetical protein
VQNNPPVDVDAQVQKVVREILALRRLTKDTRFQTSKSQSHILASLSPEVLARVAVILSEMEGAQ